MKPIKNLIEANDFLEKFIELVEEHSGVPHGSRVNLDHFLAECPDGEETDEEIIFTWLRDQASDACTSAGITIRLEFEFEDIPILEEEIKRKREKLKQLKEKYK